MRKFKKNELESLREAFREKKGTRAQFLLYAFLRKVPYRVIEGHTRWDEDENYLPGELVGINFCYEVLNEANKIKEVSSEISNIDNTGALFISSFKTWTKVPAQQYQKDEAAQTHKLVVITRTDISSGLQISQTVHSVTEYEKAHNEQYKKWRDNSNTVVCLGIDNENKLACKLKEISQHLDIAHFNEPDINNELTSIAFVFDFKNKELYKELRLNRLKLLK